MKPISLKRLVGISVRILLLFSSSSLFGQGRILINEYLSWPGNSCNVTSEYVELYNFGPGPVNIGGYILTDGDYAITIPANTLVLPGQYFVIAGQNSLPIGCANTANSVTVNLNWNTCNCTSAPIPATGDGFLTDGGSGSEQVVLFNQSMAVVDAIVRDTPEPSAFITSSTVGGTFPAQSFDLDNIVINYEQVGESQGRGNSFARLTRGGCGWLKDPQQSAGAENNTPGGQLYSTALTVTNSSTCTNQGSVAINISSTNMAQIFPMRYIVGFDVDNNNLFTQADQYSTGVDSISPVINLNNLSFGRYRVVVETAKGCDLSQVDFVILNCFTILPVIFNRFWLSASAQNNLLQWEVTGNADIDHFDVEYSLNGTDFTQVSTVEHSGTGDKASYKYRCPSRNTGFYRIKLNTQQGATVYSSVLSVKQTVGVSARPLLYPNPFSGNFFTVENLSTEAVTGSIDFYATDGRRIYSTVLRWAEGQKSANIKVEALQKGLYFISIRDSRGSVIYSGAATRN